MRMRSSLRSPFCRLVSGCVIVRWDATRSTSTTRTTLDNNAYAPFGEPYAQTENGEISFTGQNKDTLWLQYDFMFRQ